MNNANITFIDYVSDNQTQSLETGVKIRTLSKRKPFRNPNKSPEKDPSKEPPKEPSKDPSKDPLKEPSKNPEDNSSDEDSSDEDYVPKRPKRDPSKSLQNIIFIMDRDFENLKPPPPPNQNKQLQFQKNKKDLCRNPECNHKTFEEDPSQVYVSSIDRVNDIEDLIALGRTYHCKKNTSYMGINLRLLCNLIAPLTEMCKLVGMKTVKTQMVDQILFFLQGLNKKERCGSCHDCAFALPCAKNQDEMLHTIITGPPGVGKTKLGKILGKVYMEMGILDNGETKVVSRPDLIGEFLGSTAIKTQKVIDSCKGGVLFIDEAYSLGNSEGRDSFSKECIDTLNKNLSEKRDFLCIIAGYKESLDKCFFNYNEGLARRFTFRYDVECYDAIELYKIFCLNAKIDGWHLPSETNQLLEEEEKKFFIKNYSSFPNYGGDIETLFLMCKIANSRTIGSSIKYIFSMQNLSDGFDMYIKNRNSPHKSNNCEMWN